MEERGKLEKFKEEIMVRVRYAITPRSLGWPRGRCWYIEWIDEMLHTKPITRLFLGAMHRPSLECVYQPW